MSPPSAAVKKWNRELYLHYPSEQNWENVAYFSKDTPQPYLSAVGGNRTDYPRTLTVSCGNIGAAVDVTIKGSVHGVSGVVETIHCPAWSGNGAQPTVETKNAWDSDVSVTWTMPAGWTAGSISLDFGVAFGIPVEPGFTNLVVYKEASQIPPTPPYPAEVRGQPVGVLDATYATYRPTTPIHSGGANQTILVVVWYSYDY